MSSGGESSSESGDVHSAVPGRGDERGYELLDAGSRGESEPVELPATGAADTAADAAASSGVAPDAATTFDPASSATPPSTPLDFPDEPPPVDELWNRWIEWKEPIVWSGSGIAAALLVAFGGAWVATLLLLAALSYGAYALIISLEVPVRVTPEQAAREFYLALSHRFPNYRRMYALLTRDGKRSEAFRDFAEFRAYWRAEVTRLSRRPPWFIPLDFRVESFHCRYNGEKTMASVRYTLAVAHRGAVAANETIAEFDVHSLVVKAQDGHWYLNDGVLPND